MKRLVFISVLAFLTFTTGVASAAVLKPLAAPSAWNSDPIFATAPPKDPRLFVVERGNSTSDTAAVRVLKDGVLQPTPFLTVPNVNLDSERGLLSMAFAPDFATSGLFYVFYVANGTDSLDPAGTVGQIRIVEYKASATNPDIADPASARLVFKTPHSAGNHNGGWMAFGPDGKLYFSIGDNADRTNAQDTSKVFGKILRIDPADPDGAGPLTATIPADNPFVGTAGARDEVYTRGLRNPFRDSFAPNGDLIIADVGESTTEEVNVGNFAGRNMGWPTCEGPCATPNADLTDPFFTYGHAGPPSKTNGCAIIGGYVVRDPDLTGLTGRYLYGDACRTDLRTLNLSVAGGDPVDPDMTVSGGLLSFGEDNRGCTYVLTTDNAYRVAADASSPVACPHPVPVDGIPDPPIPTVDTARPSVTFSIKARHLARHIRFFVKADEKSAFRTTGALKAKRRGKKPARSFKFRPVTVGLEADVNTKVELTIGNKALRNARKVFRSGRPLKAKLVTVATDPSGNERTSSITINIRRGKH